MSNEVASDFGEEPKKELRAWLITQPREVSIMIASRAALRLAPLATIGFQPSDERKQRRLENLLSMLFRAAALARTAATCADRMNGITSAAKHAAIRSQLVPGGALDTAATAAAFATFTDNPASDAANVASAHSLRSIAFNFFKDVSFREVDSNIWNQISTDVRFIAQRTPLTGTPLWTMANWANKTTSPLQTVVVGRQGSDGEPRALSPDWVLSYWRVIKAALPLKDDWDVWINWYEDRLTGRAQSEDYELVFASVPNEVWDRGPAAANRWIKEHLPKQDMSSSESDEELLARLRQDPNGAQIEIVAGRAKLSDVALEDDAAAATDTQTQQLHEQVKGSAAVARDLVGRLANQRGFERISATVEEFARAVQGDTMSVAANISKVWALSAAIGTFIDRDDAVRAGRGGLTQPMDAEPREALDYLSVVTAPFVRRFPTALANDEHARQSRRPATALGSSKRIFEAARSASLLEAETERVMALTADAGERSESFQAEKATSWFRKTTKNIVVRYVALTIATGFFAKVGEVAFDQLPRAQSVIEFLTTQKKEIAELLSDLPPDVGAAVHEVIRRLEKAKKPPDPFNRKTQRI
jgi:hypothetical protein